LPTRAITANSSAPPASRINCRRRADDEGWSVAREFTDKAIGGADSTRPQYRDMLSAAERGEFDVLVIDDLSRLARDQVESERAIRRLAFLGIRIVAISDGYDSQTKIATRKIQRAVKGLVNEMRLDELREQFHRGLTGQMIARDLNARSVPWAGSTWNAEFAGAAVGSHRLFARSSEIRLYRTRSLERWRIRSQSRHGQTRVACTAED
jgi:hypothetical protein